MVVIRAETAFRGKTDRSGDSSGWVAGTAGQAWSPLSPMGCDSHRCDTPRSAPPAVIAGVRPQPLQPIREVAPHEVLRVVDVGRRAEGVAGAAVALAPEVGVVADDGGRVPRQPPAELVPHPVLVLCEAGQQVVKAVPNRAWWHAVLFNLLELQMEPRQVITFRETLDMNVLCGG